MLDGDMNLAITLSDTTGLVSNSNYANAARLGRHVDAIVGHDWREWILPSTHAVAERMVALAAAGTPQSKVSIARRPDHRWAVSRLTLLPARSRRRSNRVLGLHRTIVLTGDTATPSAAGVSPSFDPAAYVAELSAKLAAMAGTAGLVDLSTLLSLAVAHASGMTPPG